MRLRVSWLVLLLVLASGNLAVFVLHERAPKVASVTITPNGAKLAPTEETVLTCQPRNSAGTLLTNASCAWKTNDTTKVRIVATTGRTATINAVAVGKPWVRAVAQQKSDTVWIEVATAPTPPDTTTPPVPPDTTTPPPDTTTPPPVATCDIARGALMLYSNFEEAGPPWPRVVNDNDFWSGLWIGQVGVQPYSLTRDSVQANECRTAAHIELHKSDPIIAGSKRAQVMIDKAAVTGNGGVPVPSGKTLSGGLGDERWFGFSVFIPSSWVFETAWAPETIFEVINGGRSPFFEIETDKTQWVVITRTGSGPQGDPSWKVSCWTCPPQPAAPPIARGVWTDFVVHAVWSATTTGLLQVWMNGVKVVDRVNLATAFSDIGSVSKPSWGIYKWSWTGTNSITTERWILLDNIRVTDGAHGGYSTVAPR